MIEIDETTVLGAVFLPSENGVNIGITVPGHEKDHMWVLTPDHIAAVLKGGAVEVAHAARPDEQPNIITDVPTAVRMAVNERKPS